MKLIKLRKEIIFSFFVFLLFSFFRFYNLPKRLSFDWDQEYYSYQVKNILNGDLTLIGPRVNNDKGFFLAPYFFYLLVPFYLIKKLHPQSLFYFVIFYNLLFFIITFYTLKKTFHFKTVLFFLFFWSINPLLISFDVTPWNANWVILGIVITFLVLYTIYQDKENIFNWIFLGLNSGLFFHFHFQFVFIIFFSFLFIIFFLKKKILNYFRKILFSLGCFLFTFFPLFLFDLRHNFLNTKLFFEFFFGEKINPYDRKIWFTVFLNSFNPLMIIKNSVFGVFFYFLILFFLIFLIKNKKNFYRIFFESLLGLWLIFPIIFSLYGVRPSEYYFYFIYPFIFIILIEFSFLIKKQIFLVIYLMIIFFLNFNSLRDVLKSYDFGLYYKDQAVRKIKELVNLSTDFNITFDMPLGLNNGYNYLIDFYQIKQSQDFSDPLIEIRVPPKERDIKINKIGLKIPEKLLKK